VGVLTLERVSKRFDHVLAVNDLSFTVEPGTVFGFLGGNGAGKTTSLRMVLDIIRPTSGRIDVLGRPPGQVLEEFRQLPLPPDVMELWLSGNAERLLGAAVPQAA